MGKPALLILAAGIGSRYGSLKQLDQIGPSGETIMDYSIYDALKAGFGKIVFVIRKSIENEFRKDFLAKMEGIANIGYVLQELDKIPEGTLVHPERQRPWGTGHAVLMARDVIQEPFAVINADDFYGREAFVAMAAFLKQPPPNEFAMIGYNLGNTLSEHGAVSRGVCKVDDNGYLTGIVEHTKIISRQGAIYHISDEKHETELEPDTMVSMNFWGFTPEIFSHLDETFRRFIIHNSMTLKGELYIPAVVSELIADNKFKFRVLQSGASWFGITYKEDKPAVMERIRQLTDQGIYPYSLWN